jgi:hypothetical protein
MTVHKWWSHRVELVEEALSQTRMAVVSRRKMTPYLVSLLLHGIARPEAKQPKGETRHA